MLAGLIRDEERAVLSGVPGLSDIPLVGRLFANNHRETAQTDIILTLTPHIVRVLDLTEADLRPFRLGRDAGIASLSDVLGGAVGPPRDQEPQQPPAATQPPPSLQVPPARTQPPFPQPLQGTLPGTPLPVQSPPAPKKPGGGGQTNP
jgi:general secretion pathway protein D